MAETRFGLYPQMLTDHFAPPQLGGLSTVSADTLRGIPDPATREAYAWRDWRDVAALTTGLSDMRELGYSRHLPSTSVRMRIARFGVLTGALLVGAQWLVAAPGEHEPKDADLLLANCQSVLLTGELEARELDVFEGTVASATEHAATGAHRRSSWPGRRRGVSGFPADKDAMQRASYGLATYIHGKLSNPKLAPGFSDHDHAKDDLERQINGLRQNVADQLRLNDVGQLVGVAAAIGGYTTKALLAMGEMVTVQGNEGVRKGAYSFGAGAAVLGAWTGVLEGLRSGPHARTFATEFLRQEGAAPETLEALKTMALDTANDHFNASRDRLEVFRQREILRTMRWLVERKFALDRMRHPITPETAAAALAS